MSHAAAPSPTFPLSRRLQWFAFALVVLVADLGTKAWVVDHLASPAHPMIVQPADAATPLAALTARGLSNDEAKKAMESGLLVRLRRHKWDAAATIGTDLIGQDIFVTEGTRQPGPRRLRLDADDAGQTVAAVLAQEWRLDPSDIQPLLDRAGWQIAGRSLPADAPWASVEAVALLDRNIVISPSWAQFVYAENKGAAFSFLHSAPPLLRFALFVFISSVASLGMAWWLLRGEGTSLLMWSLAAILGGAVGNLVDRVRYSVVVDFIYNYIEIDGKVHGWPVYNIADIGITCGIILIALESIFRKPPVAPPTAPPFEPSTEIASSN